MSTLPNPMRGEGASQPAGPSPRDRRDPLQLRDRRHGERRDTSLAVHLTEQVVVLAAEQWADAVAAEQAALTAGTMHERYAALEASRGLQHAVRAYKAARATVAPDLASEAGGVPLELLCWVGAIVVGLCMTQAVAGSWARAGLGLVACALVVAGWLVDRRQVRP